ncbi:transmembrane protein 131 [Bacillus rossius redtenbacheri]|uniref:transmembrane protein 131 n=1 Tax=Bacillus rossius redtenbacheri TaxID=93214 RepID=UPI002FDED2DD
MGRNTVCFEIFIFMITLLNTKLTVDGNNNGFLQANNDVQYISVHKEFSSSSRIRVAIPQLAEESWETLRFQPPLLDFKQRQLGLPHRERVTLFNVHDNRTVLMSSISGSTVHFHSSFFDDKVLPPLGNTSFHVVFLGREEGNIESSLFIHTSEGSFRYQVRGASVSSPYRLRALVGVRLPLNSSYSPLLHLYNPSSRPLQVLEAYSSGADFQLELPSGASDAPLQLWQIPPFHTRPVVKIRFVARAHRNHTAYVRLRVSGRKEALVVPVEVQVGPRPGLYALDDLLDFGFGSSCDQPRQLRLLLYNSGSKSLRIQSIVAKPASKALKIDFQPIKVPPDSRIPTRVAVLTFNWTSVPGGVQSGRIFVKGKQGTSVPGGVQSGRIFVKGKQGQHRLVLPYVAHALEGCLVFNASLAQFCHEGELARSVRHFSVTNTFSVPVAVLNVSLHRDAQPFFQVENFVPRVLSAGESSVLFQLSLGKNISVTDVKLETNLWLHTNVSRVFVPVLCYNGHLDVAGGARLDLGLLGVGASVLHHLAVVNRNPSAVHLLDWGTNASWTGAQLLGTAHGDASLALAGRAFHDLVNTTELLPGHFAVLAVTATAPSREGPLWASLQLRTQFQRLSVSLEGQVAHGSLRTVPPTVLLADCFPGRVCSERVEVRSNFSRAMTVLGVASVPPDARLWFRPEDTVVAPRATSALGRLLFDCSASHRYLGAHNSSAGAWHWLQTLALPPHTADHDSALFSARQLLFQQSPRRLPFAVRLDTSAVRGHVFQAEARLTWPLLANWSLVRLPLTQVGNTTRAAVSLHNPSRVVVVAQLVLDWAYPHPDRPRNSSERGLWRLQDPDGRTAQDLQEELGVPSHEDSVTAVLYPGQKKLFTLAFTPHSPGQHHASLFIRNNLTVLEVVRLAGTAGVPLFKFGNRSPASDVPLLFQLADKHLHDCTGEGKGTGGTRNLSVKRSFTARNHGELPVFVSGFSVSGLACEGYGFRVLNCGGFELPPNGTRRVEVAFTPDFTLARVQRSLQLATSLGQVVFPLVATLPPSLLAPCSAALGRPAWEPLLHHCAVGLGGLLLLCVAAAACLEAGRVLEGAGGRRPGRVLDLRRLASRARRRPGRRGAGPSKGRGPPATASASASAESSNNDEADKEVPDCDCKQSPAEPKPEDKCADYEGDCDEDEENEGSQEDPKMLRWKPGCKAPAKVPGEPRQAPTSLELPYKLKSRNLGRERCKNLLKHRSSDKPAATTVFTAGAESRSVPQSRAPSSWADVKASFSNASPSYSSVVAPRPSPPETVSLDCSASSLGPIGSKIASPKGHWESFMNETPAPPHFLQQEPAPRISLATFQDPLQSAGDGRLAWEEPASRDEAGRTNIFTESWPASLWDPFCSPAVATTDPPDPMSLLGGRDGHSSIWSSNPWSPAAGPARREQRSEDMTLGLSPFPSLDDIWLPCDCDIPWSPPPTQN